MDKKWIEKPTLRLDELGHRVAALRVAAAKKGEFDTSGFDRQLEWQWRVGK